MFTRFAEQGKEAETDSWITGRCTCAASGTMCLQDRRAKERKDGNHEIQRRCYRTTVGRQCGWPARAEHTHAIVDRATQTATLRGGASAHRAVTVHDLADGAQRELPQTGTSLDQCGCMA